MSNPKFEIFKSTANSEYYYHLRATNGEIVLNGEGYTTNQSCRKGIASVKENAPFDSRYNRKGILTYSFNLEAGNGEVIGRSETYNSSAARESGIAAVKRMRQWHRSKISARVF